MQLDYTHQLVKRLGAKVFAVYFLMACAEAEGLVPVTHKWLYEQMPYSTSPNTVTAALKTLTDPENQFAVRVTGGWRLTTTLQLPLANQIESSVDPKITQRVILNHVVVNVESEESQDLLSTTLTNKVQNHTESDFGKSRNVSILQIVKDSDEIKACLAALHELKIYGKKAHRIAEDHHISVEDINGHWKTVQTQAWDNPQGMLIYLLENHVPVEEQAIDQNSTSNRYSSGVYGKLLNQDSDPESEDE